MTHMPNTLKLSTLQTQSASSEQLNNALLKIEELERQLSAQRKANVSMAAKVTDAITHADQTLINENNWLQKKLDEVQHQRQVEALEGLVGQDSKAQQKTEENKTLRKELGEIKKALKAMQALDPEKQKKTIATQKKKMTEQTTTIKELDRKLKLANKEISQLKKEAAEQASAEATEDSAAEPATES